MKSLVVTAFCLLLMTSCKQKINRKDATCQIDLQEMSSPSFYDYFSRIEIIPLETSKEILIKEVSETTYYNGNFYVLDKLQKIIFIFNKEGRFLRKIDKRGNGPGEYSDLIDFKFNSFTGGLDLLNPMGGILRYDCSGQKFKEKISLPLTVSAIHNFMALSEDIYIFFCKARDGGKMIVFDIRQKKIISEMYDLPTFIFFKTFYHHSYSPFYVYEDRPHFVQAYNGDVFTFEKNLLVQKYLWDFGEQNFEISELKEKSIEYYIKHAQSAGAKYANTFVAYGENSRYYLTEFFFDNKICSLIYDKQKQICSVFNTFEEGHRCIPTFVDESAVYSFSRVSDINITVNIQKLDETNKKICEGLTDDDNPVVIKYIFKK